MPPPLGSNPPIWYCDLSIIHWISTTYLVILELCILVFFKSILLKEIFYICKQEVLQFAAMETRRLLVKMELLIPTTLVLKKTSRRFQSACWVGTWIMGEGMIMGHPSMTRRSLTITYLTSQMEQMYVSFLVLPFHSHSTLLPLMYYSVSGTLRLFHLLNVRFLENSLQHPLGASQWHRLRLLLVEWSVIAFSLLNFISTSRIASYKYTLPDT